MPSPESFGGANPNGQNAQDINTGFDSIADDLKNDGVENSAETREADRLKNAERGEKVNEIEIKRRRKAELEAGLAARGINLETIETELSPSELANEAKNKARFKKAITSIVIGLTATIAVGGIAAHGIASAKAAGGVITNAPIVVEETAPAMVVTQPVTEVTFEKAEAEKGIIDGYDKDGMWLADSKPNTVAFSDFEKVVRNFNGNVKEAIKYTDGNEVEALSDHVSALPAGAFSVIPQGGVLSQFKGLNEQDTNSKIENQLSADEVDSLRQEFNNLIDSNASIEEITLDGKYSNAYMAVKDGSSLLGSKAAIEKGATINHENMQLIVCHTNEKNTKAYKVNIHDANGKTVGSFIIKGSCAQAVEQEGSSTRFVGLPEAAETAINGGGPITIITGGGGIKKPDPEPKKDPEPDPGPKPKPKPKWGKSGDPHGGDLVTPSDLVDPSAEVTKEYIEHVNDGNQGYIDDGGAAPGSSSEANGVGTDGFAGSGIIADGATKDEGRLEGGQDQSDGNMAGDNAYHDEQAEAAGREEDSKGNEAQAEAQDHNDAGGDNNSDREEERRVAEGDF